MTPTNKKREHSTDTAYIEAIGRRKTATARVRLLGHGTGITINDKPYQEYFPQSVQRQKVEEPLRVVEKQGKLKLSVVVTGGGSYSQAEAVRHGIARALIKSEPDLQQKLRANNLVTRDPRMKERRKFGLKKARRAPQWSKR